MNSKISRLVRSICLSALFGLTFFSAFQGRDAATGAPASVHIVAGSLLLIGSLVHIGTNVRWIRAAFKRSASQPGKRLRGLRFTSLCLFISGTACASTAGIWLLSLVGFDTRFIGRLHTLSGLTMSLFLFIHLLQHRRWLVQTIRSLREANRGQEIPAQKEFQAGS
jgi:hypothetical protein